MHSISLIGHGAASHQTPTRLNTRRSPLRATESAASATCVGIPAPRDPPERTFPYGRPIRRGRSRPNRGPLPLAVRSLSDPSPLAALITALVPANLLVPVTVAITVAVRATAPAVPASPP